jgi:hypothetical protein
MLTSPGGLFVMDDEETWTEALAPARGVIGERYPLNLQLGLGRELPVKEHEYFAGSDLPGEMCRTWPDEGNQRAYYARWQEMMQGKSWSDLGHTEPATTASG